MKTTNIIILTIELLHVLYKGLNNNMSEKVEEVEKKEKTRENKQTVNWQPYVGYGMMVIGVAFLTLGRKKSLSSLENDQRLSTKRITQYLENTKAGYDKKQFSFTEARQIGDALNIPWDKFGVEQFRMGLNVELEHGRRDLSTDVTHDEPLVTGKIALAHLNEIPNYYTRLAVMEDEAERM